MEEGLDKVVVEGDCAFFPGVVGGFMTRLKGFALCLRHGELVKDGLALVVVPAVGEQNAADVPEDGGVLGHSFFRMRVMLMGVQDGD